MPRLRAIPAFFALVIFVSVFAASYSGLLSSRDNWPVAILLIVSIGAAITCYRLIREHSKTISRPFVLVGIGLVLSFGGRVVGQLGGAAFVPFNIIAMLLLEVMGLVLLVVSVVTITKQIWTS